jgi:hypothetical protein
VLVCGAHSWSSSRRTNRTHTSCLLAGLEQDGKVISTIEHLVRTRKGGYLFAPKK